MDILQVFSALWQGLAGSLGSDAMAVLVVAAFATAITSVWLVVNAFRKTEFYKQHQTLWALVDDRIADLIWLIEVGDVDLTEYNKRADEREAKGESFIDPRMLYLLDQAQAWVQAKLGVELDFEELLARA